MLYFQGIFAHFSSLITPLRLFAEKKRLKLDFLTLPLLLSLQFVAQPNCQQLLATLWYDGFPGWRRRHWAVKLVTCFIIGLLFPVFSLVWREEGGANIQAETLRGRGKIFEEERDEARSKRRKKGAKEYTVFSFVFDCFIHH